MYCIGDQVIYGIHGVCRIVDEECRSVDRKQLNYLVLEPDGQTGARYLVPTHNAVAMGKLRKILTAEEMEALLCSDTVRSAEWIRDDNQRKQIYRDLVSGGDRVRLCGWCICCTHIKQSSSWQEESSISVMIIFFVMQKNF